ncbi:ATP-binding protein [Streptomyces albidoflavus]|uniref:ATP-binding protein n=1 Tax=Streptomyces albidoflavus TaxID=1886 RepID=UPI00101E5BC1|nr:ATP-binding protein [Streptomyces albidoflavus]RZD65888.1 ATP-binding protein [Streptomyces albidoflavus]
MNQHSRPSALCERFFRRERRSVPAARGFAAEVLDSWGCRVARADLLLCVSELATNALLHGVPPGRGFRLVLARADDGGVRVEVHDSGDGHPATRAPGDEAESGRGLLLVSALADDWGVGKRNPGKIVWCSFRPVGVSCPGR